MIEELQVQMGNIICYCEILLLSVNENADQKDLIGIIMNSVNTISGRILKISELDKAVWRNEILNPFTAPLIAGHFLVDDFEALSDNRKEYVQQICDSAQKSIELITRLSED